MKICCSLHRRSGRALAKPDRCYTRFTGFILFYWSHAEYAYGILHWLGNRIYRDESR